MVFALCRTSLQSEHTFRNTIGLPWRLGILLIEIKLNVEMIPMDNASLAVWTLIKMILHTNCTNIVERSTLQLNCGRSVYIDATFMSQQKNTPPTSADYMVRPSSRIYLISKFVVNQLLRATSAPTKARICVCFWNQIVCLFQCQILAQRLKRIVDAVSTGSKTPNENSQKSFERYVVLQNGRFFF